MGKLVWGRGKAAAIILGKEETIQCSLTGTVEPKMILGFLV